MYTILQRTDVNLKIGIPSNDEIKSTKDLTVHIDSLTYKVEVKNIGHNME